MEAKAMSEAEKDAFSQGFLEGTTFGADAVINSDTLRLQSEVCGELGAVVDFMLKNAGEALADMPTVHAKAKAVMKRYRGLMSRRKNQ